MFKGYLKSHGKVCKETIKGGNYKSVPPIEMDSYVGVLEDNIVQLDFDSEEDATKALEIVEKLDLKCNVLKTSRGIHLYFLDDGSIKSQSVSIFNTIGLKCDVGLGSKTRVVPLKVFGEQRVWLREVEELEFVPPYFKPLCKKDYGIANCTTRNQTLFNYILTLQSYNFNKEEVRNIYQVINDFILYEPLEQSELDSITREEAFSEEIFFDGNGKFLHDKFGNFMLANCNIMLLDGIPHIYNRDNKYSSYQKDFEIAMLEKIQNLKRSHRTEVYEYIVLQCTREGQWSPPNYIGFKDKVYDIETDTIHDYSPEFVIPNTIKYNYRADAYNKYMDEMLDNVSCGDKQIRALLEEMIGDCFYRATKMQKMFVLTGEGSNGKSTFLDCVKELLGAFNYSSLDMRDMESTFLVAEIKGKLANLGDDISAKFLESCSILKKLVTGESFVSQKKYQHPIDSSSYATLVFCANEVPMVADKSNGYSRRFVPIPFNAEFKASNNNLNVNIKDELMKEDAIEYLLKLGVEGLKRTLKNGKFTTSEKVNEEKAKFELENNNVLQWLHYQEPKIENEETKDCYLAYKVWCASEGITPYKQGNFSKIVIKTLGLKSSQIRVGGKRISVFKKA